jgi:hypothetical protein
MVMTGVAGQHVLLVLETFYSRRPETGIARAFTGAAWACSSVG